MRWESYIYLVSDLKKKFYSNQINTLKKIFLPIISHLG